jgi:hypothetical protein
MCGTNSVKELRNFLIEPKRTKNQKKVACNKTTKSTRGRPSLCRFIFLDQESEKIIFDTLENRFSQFGLHSSNLTAPQFFARFLALILVFILLCSTIFPCLCLELHYYFLRGHFRHFQNARTFRLSSSVPTRLIFANSQPRWLFFGFSNSSSNLPIAAKVPQFFPWRRSHLDSFSILHNLLHTVSRWTYSLFCFVPTSLVGEIASPVDSRNQIYIKYFPKYISSMLVS